MGKLRKTIVDMIVRLRKKGYTQAETAEKAGVNLKTVRKYDPLRQSDKTPITKVVKGPSAEDLEHYIKCLGDWVDSLATTVQHDLGAKLMCPKCGDGSLVSNETGDKFFCDKCRYEMPLPSYVWEED